MKIVGVAKCGNKIAYYGVQDDSGNISNVSKDDVVRLVQSKDITNAKTQMWNGNAIVRIKDNVKTIQVTNVQTTKNKPAPTVVHKEASSVATDIASGILGNKPIRGSKAVNWLKGTTKGTPLKIRVSDYKNFEQVIYMGLKEVQNREAHVFFNGQGASGTFALSENYIIGKTDIEIVVGDNDPCEVNFLLNYIKKGPFEIN